MSNRAVSFKRVKFLRVWGAPSTSQIFGPGDVVRVTDYWHGVLTRGGIAESLESCSDCPPAGYPTDKTRCDSCPLRYAPETPTPRADETQRDAAQNGSVEGEGQ